MLQHYLKSPCLMIGGTSIIIDEFTGNDSTCHHLVRPLWGNSLVVQWLGLC